MNPREYSSAIIDLQRKKDYHSAYQLIMNALSEYPTNPFFLRSEIYALYRLGRLKEARQKAEARLELLKTDTFFLKTYLSILEKIKASKKDMENLIDSILLWNIVEEDFYVFLSRLSARVLGREKADSVLREAVIRIPHSAILKDMLSQEGGHSSLESRYKGYKARFQGKGADKAIEEIELIMAMPEYSSDYELSLYLAELYKETGRLERSAEIYKRLLQVRDNEFTRKMLGYVYYKMGDYVNARNYLRDVFLKAPQDHFIYSTIYKIYQALRDYEGLKGLFDEALAANPGAKHLYGLIRKAEQWRQP